jgi:regulator of sigma E protease
MFLVIIHEFGHFWTSRKFGVKVQEFGVGIPPKVTTLATDKKWTEYTLNRIPLGWFVRLKGEDPSDETEFLAPDSFISAPLHGKLIILFWWIIANVLFAWLAFSLSFWQWVTPLSILPDTATRVESTSYLMPSYSFLEREGLVPAQDPTIVTPALLEQVLPESRASNVWLRSGDTLLSIDNEPVSVENLTEILRNKYNTWFTLTYLQDGVEKNTAIVCWSDECLLGVSLTTNTPQQTLRIQFPLLKSIWAGRHEVVAQTRMSFSALGKIGAGLFSFNKEQVASSTKSLSGPVGIVKMIELIIMRGGWWQLLAFAGMISLALAIFNILPIPALDGWRALSVLIQAIWGWKPTSYFKIEWWLNMFFFVLLMWLGIVIIFKDLNTARGVKLPFIW